MIRFYIALWASKLSVIALKLTGHNATDFPGTVALKLCPDFLKYVSKPSRIIGITGTNGKTTVTNMITDALTATDLKVLSNKEGSNIKTGIATIFMKGVNVFNRSTYDLAVLEIDERSAPVLFPYFKPEILVINNLTRDSTMRNAHPEFIAGILTEELPKTTKLVINGDDLIACSVAPENERVYFGIDSLDTDTDKCINLINDMRVCPKCHSKLEFDKVRYHHIGKVHCPSCGFKSPECKYSGSNADFDRMMIDITENGKTYSVKLINDSVFNIYNSVCTTALLREMGYSAEDVVEMMSVLSIVKSRLDEKKAGSYTLIRQLAKDKNALATSRVLDYISSRPGRKEIIMMMNCLHDTVQWSENTCWLYDCDFEFLKNEDFVRIIVTGERCLDYVLRLRFAGVDMSRIKAVFNYDDIAGALKLEEGTDVYLLNGTDSIKAADKVEAEILERMRKKSEGGME